ncbi:MAG TPA: aminotransferase class III-fold pyridoxal phosphate-dependent enzyme [Gemmataceae bacterium]|jgi:4-aminobutyrate aminotransferase-like enzyme|nr:aminotransferase class III-fold pyridoxal phosphate-dependent enzyme [Gemmataceae bacterium]
MTPIQHPQEKISNPVRESIAQSEPKTIRTFTPSQAIIARSAGIYHWTPEDRRLYDFTSGVLVANLGHNPVSWTKRFFQNMGWPASIESPSVTPGTSASEYFSALPMTAYNAITPVEAEASARLLALLQSCPGGKRLEQVLWAASGSEAIQKALWASMARDRERPMILATRYGFHGKKGLAGAVTGCETDHERDPRVRFISFPMAECRHVSLRGTAFDFGPYQRELTAVWAQFGRKIGTLITEPYLGGGGSYHPPKEYLQLLQSFCREHDVVLILDEVQSNFGRTGNMFAYETYGIEPDIVVLGKGLGNGVPVAAAVGRRDIFSSLEYGEGSDTWSANPLCCAAVLATLDEFAARDVLGEARKSSALIEKGLLRLKELPFIANIRGELGGMVWGLEMRDAGGKSAADWANACVLACYLGDGKEGIHLLGPLAKKVLRIAPPLTITEAEARAAMELMHRLLVPLLRMMSSAPAGGKN